MAVVLIVDDDVGFRETSSQMLRLDGYQVTVADSVRGALAILRDEVPDALLLDWKLPDGTGLDVLRWTDGRKSPIPAALITGFWMDSEYPVAEAAARRLGVEIVVQRGVDFEEPGAIVHRLLDPLANLHLSVLCGDVEARDTIANELTSRTLSRLRARFRAVSPDLVRAAVLDAVMRYVEQPWRFKPGRHISIERFVYMDARRRLCNDMRAERRRQEREKFCALRPLVTAAPQSIDASPGQMVIAQAFAKETDPRARAALRAWLHGEAGMSPWLEIPTVAMLPPEERCADVARRKGKFTARVKRLARRADIH